MREAHLRSWLLPSASTASDSTMPPRRHPCHLCPIPQSSLYTTLSPACFLSHHPSRLSQIPGTSFISSYTPVVPWISALYIFQYLPLHCLCCSPPTQSRIFGDGSDQGYGAHQCSLLPRTSQYLGIRNVLSVIHCLDDFPKLLNCSSQVQCSWKVPRKSTFET